MTYKEALNILELDSNASPADAQKAYRKLAKHFHPDKNSAPDAAIMFRRINEAYQHICDEYDRQQVEEAQQEEARQQAEERRQEEEARRQAADAQQQVGQAEESKKQGQVKRTESVIEKHYWRAVTFLVAVILIGAGFWGLRRFNPALFLGKPDFIAVPNEDRPQQSVQDKPTLQKPELLNINTASAEELETLSGIGPQMAQRIIQYREEHGPFTSVDALTEVKGLGEKTLEKLKPFINVK